MDFKMETITSEENEHEQMANVDAESNTIIGSGGYGQVYIKRLEHSVVRKLFHFNRADTALHEFEVLRYLPTSCFFPRLMCTQLAYLKDDKDRYYQYFDMAYEENSISFADALDEQRNDLNKMVMIGDLILAYGQLRDSKILHLDLKPDNCLIVSNSHLKLIDFGHSCKIGSTINVTGTIAYTSPELLKKVLKRDEFMAEESDDMFTIGHLICAFMTEKCSYNHMTQYAEQEHLTMPKKHNSAADIKFFKHHYSDHEYVNFILGQFPLKEKKNQAIAYIISKLIHPQNYQRHTYDMLLEETFIKNCIDKSLATPYTDKFDQMGQKLFIQERQTKYVNLKLKKAKKTLYNMIRMVFNT